MQRAFIRNATLAVLCAALLCTTAIPAYAFWGKRSTPATSSTTLTRNVVLGQSLCFQAEDFAGTEDDALAAVTITSLPDHNSGMLTVGGQAVSAGAVVHTQALDGLRFHPVSTATADHVDFIVTPTFASGTQGSPVTVNIHLLAAPNEAPIAQNLSLKTYRNVAITGQFQATDTDNDELTFQLTSSPARGSVAVSEQNPDRFVYTPYDNKTGKDTFTYVAVDRAGNLSNPAKVTIRIEKASSGITYADMNGHPAHHAAMLLAEQDLFIGEQVNGLHVFAPETPVNRSEFLALAMSVSKLPPLTQVSLTGFFDDEAIPTWSKGYVSSALMAGAISGTHNEQGQAVFCAERTITYGEAAAMLDHLLGVSDVAVETWASAGISHSNQDHWAMQSAADLACAGVLQLESSTPTTLDTPLTRGDAAMLLSDSFRLLENRNHGLFG